MTEQPIALALVRRAGKWLVAQRRGNAHLGGKWEFPGGKCHPGESVSDAAVRELREECGVVAQPCLALPPRLCEYDDRRVRLHPVVCEHVSGDARPLESQQCRWISIDEFAGLDMPPVNRQIIADLQAALALPDAPRAAK